MILQQIQNEPLPAWCAAIWYPAVDLAQHVAGNGYGDAVVFVGVHAGFDLDAKVEGRANFRHLAL